MMSYGEPCDWKRSRTVQKGGDGKVPIRGNSPAHLPYAFMFRGLQNCPGYPAVTCASQGIPFCSVGPVSNLLLSYKGFKDTACFDLWLATFHILEMLYDTPFPTEPQNDLSTKMERNAEIRARYEKGESVRELAVAFGISEQRVWQIIRGQRN